MRDSDKVVRFVSRALAGDWPYDPDQMKFRRHPALANRTDVEARFFVLPDEDERSIQIAIELIRRNARLLLKNKTVRHFEVTAQELVDHIAVLHDECQGEGCDECNMLGVLFQEVPGQHVSLMGWQAVVNRVLQ